MFQSFLAFCLSKWLGPYVNYDRKHYDAERKEGRSEWPRDLRRGTATARLLKLWVPILPEAWVSVCCVVCCQVEVSATS